MLLSVVVPCHNEEAVLPVLVEQVLAILEPRRVEVEVILVDDGSRDGTLRGAARAARRATRGCRYVVAEPQLRQGVGDARRPAATPRGDAVVIMDADLQHPPRLLRQMLDRLDEGFDQVVARRTRDGDRAGRTLAVAAVLLAGQPPRRGGAPGRRR